jgi:hypothetical protein
MASRKLRGGDVAASSTEILSRIEKLERAVFGKSGKKPARVPPGDFTGATGGLRFRVSNGFFDRKAAFGEIK